MLPLHKIREWDFPNLSLFAIEDGNVQQGVVVENRAY